MSRGGARRGAGRRRQLALLDRLSVGAECEALGNSIRDEKIQAEIESLKLALEEEFEAAKKLPVKDRKALTKQDRELMAFDVDAALQVYLGIDDERPPRVIHISTKRPKGVRSKIIEQVAHARGLTKTMVNNCWKEYRRLKLESDT